MIGLFQRFLDRNRSDETELQSFWDLATEGKWCALSSILNQPHSYWAPMHSTSPLLPQPSHDLPGASRGLPRNQLSTDSKCHNILAAHLASSKDGKRVHGSINRIAKQFIYHRDTVSKVWRSWEQTHDMADFEDFEEKGINFQSYRI